MKNNQKYEDFENEILQQIENKIKKVSEMSYSERQFLNGLIRKNRPKKIVEIGVAAGASSAIILNAINDIEGAILYSLDYNPLYYRDNNKKTGFVVDEICDQSQKWKLLTGGMSCNFLDKIGADIDICLLDTMHSNPGEFLDYLQILPYMKKNGIIILHDISLHTYTENKYSTCCTLLSAIKGQKIIPQKSEHKYFPNIGAVVLDDNAMERAFDVFNCLALPWSYMISKQDITDLKKHFSMHYDKDYVEWFLKSCEYNKKQLKTVNKQQYVPSEKCNIIVKLRKTVKICKDLNL